MDCINLLKVFDMDFSRRIKCKVCDALPAALISVTPPDKDHLPVGYISINLQ